MAGAVFAGVDLRRVLQTDVPLLAHSAGEVSPHTGHRWHSDALRSAAPGFGICRTRRGAPSRASSGTPDA